MLLPLFASSAATGAACAAMPTGPEQHAAAAHERHGDAAHSDHDHATHRDTQPVSPLSGPCPHCPLESGAAHAGHSVCAANDAPDQRGFAPAKDDGERPLSILTANWLLPAARAAPPLIETLPRPATPRVPAIRLNIAHCVLLI